MFGGGEPPRRGGLTMQHLEALQRNIRNAGVGLEDFADACSHLWRVSQCPKPNDWPGIHALFMSLAFFTELPGHVRGAYVHEETATPSKVVEHDDSGHAAHVRFANIREEIECPTPNSPVTCQQQTKLHSSTKETSMKNSTSSFDRPVE